MADFLQRLRERKLVQWALAYIAAAFALIQVLDIVAQRFGWPAQTMRLVIIVLAVGFFAALVLAWYHGERGTQRISGTELLILALLLAIGGVVGWRLVPTAEQVASTAPAAKPATASDTAVDRKSIAVLPFENLSADKDNEYFASGMQDMILTKLADIRELKVISRTSTEQYKSHPDNLKAIARQLGVATIMEGSVQRAGNSVLISVQLIDANTDAHLWAEAYTRTLDNIFGVEGDVAQKIADALKTHLSPAEQHSLSTPPTRNADAYNLYLQAGYYLRQTEAANADPAVVVPKALELYTQASLKDPSFAQAFAQMAYVRAMLYWFRIEVDQADIDEAARLADRALALDPGSAEAHAAKGYVVYWGGRDYAQALTEFTVARRLQPNVASVASAIAFIHRRQGNWQASLDENARAAALDPGDPQPLSGMAYTLAIDRRYAEAEDTLDRTLALNPEFWDALSGKALVAVFWKGDTDTARKVMAQIPDTGGPRGSVTYVRFEVAMWSRDFDAALTALDGAPERIHTNPGHELFATDLLRAQALEAAGRTDQARTAYESAARVLQHDVERQPAEAAFHAFLGRAFAGVESRVDAVREGRRAVELLPIKDDAFTGPFYLAELAKTYARLGDADEAIPLIRQLLAMPAGLVISVPVLKIDPAWDPLRKDPSFQKLIAADDSDVTRQPQAGAKR